MTRTSNLINTNFKKLKDSNNEISSIYSTKGSLSSEDSNETLQSYDDDASVNDNHQIRQKNHYIKYPKLNYNDDHMTSLKRRIRKQQLRCDQHQEIILKLSSSMDLLLISYSQQTMPPRFYRTKKSSCVVPLTLLIHDSEGIRIHIRGIKLNLYEN